MADSLVGKLPNITDGYAGNFVYNQKYFKFPPVGENTLNFFLHSLNVSKATGLDGLSASFLKDGGKSNI